MMRKGAAMEYQNASRQGGMTLIELLVAMFIALILLLLITRFFVGQNRTYEQQIDVAQMQQGLRVTMDLIRRETRKAGNDPHNIGFAGIAFDTSRLVIRADLNGDGDTADADEHIEYWVSDSVLYRTSYTDGESGGDEEVLDDVASFRITLLGANDDTLRSAADERRIRQIRIATTMRSSRRLGADGSTDGHRREDMEILVVPLNLAL
ncbi:MAG: prepilin-type N-terminal cleavage/methylation domain-containing protein [Chitinivibrionales bacterium]|nr:prepilin-type N-terminal cleavage/methylation domain-containing protein [Chitinivibrionales bacterium]